MPKPKLPNKNPLPRRRKPAQGKRPGIGDATNERRVNINLNVNVDVKLHLVIIACVILLLLLLDTAA